MAEDTTPKTTEERLSSMEVTLGKLLDAFTALVAVLSSAGVTPPASSTTVDYKRMKRPADLATRYPGDIPRATDVAGVIAAAPYGIHANGDGRAQPVERLEDVIYPFLETRTSSDLQGVDPELFAFLFLTNVIDAYGYQNPTLMSPANVKAIAAGMTLEEWVDNNLKAGHAPVVKASVSGLAETTSPGAPTPRQGAPVREPWNQ